METKGWISIKTPYKKEFVDELKAAIPWQVRLWDRINKAWLVAPTEAEKANGLVVKHFGSEDDVLEAEVGEIQASQAWIIEREQYIKEAIGALEEQINHYSFRSKSAIKGRMCRDRALLTHSLITAKVPVEELTELQVRGLKAARRLLEKYNIAQLTSRN